ncbi:hypothetical protein BTO06_05780 [Tenacibaculum sp. SZ-18]|uniref:hypothetical protein n=1 Tax=Tenacibaculum sp. SZ-18 TaxID=754423 RepID=UPI000C2D660F|nr:hypothetical protein [Tenacibaculum sp. SZ-18]AUC14679.1 hypothetical protein BTO06_05780 [Tenacibaculum sp. SZ-18]
MQKILIKNTIKLIIGGIAIGLLYQYGLLLAILLILKIAHSFYKNIKKQTLSIALVIGFVVTGIIGIAVEHAGTSNGYWEYHDISRQVPLWIFFAWGGAFILMYQIENQIYKSTPDLSDSSKKHLTLFMVAFFPTLGEIIAINLGTWKYYVSYQILEIPLAAIAALIIIHSSTNAFLGVTSKKFGIKDMVFNPQKM